MHTRRSFAIPLGVHRRRGWLLIKRGHQVHSYSAHEYAPWRSILRAKLNKMAVIWLETFHNQFDVSDRKRYFHFGGCARVQRSCSTVSLSSCRFSHSLSLSLSLSSYVCSSLADRSFSSSLNSARDTNDAFSFPFSLVLSANYFYVSLPFLRPFFGFPLALSFSDFLRRIVRRGRTQFCSSKLAVIVELYDKPTLMVKACPRRRGASLFS